MTILEIYFAKNKQTKQSPARPRSHDTCYITEPQKYHANCNHSDMKTNIVQFHLHKLEQADPRNMQSEVTGVGRGRNEEPQIHGYRCVGS